MDPYNCAVGAPKSGGSGRIANSLVALSSAAVLTVYSAGYLRTRAAAEKLDAAERSRVVIPPAPSSQPTPPIPAPGVIRASTLATPAAAPSEARVRMPRPDARPTGTPEAPSPRTATTTSATPVAPVATPAAQVAEPPATLTPTPTATPAPPVQYKDGTYTGWGTSRHGDIEATVTITGGRIASALISQCLTRYSCSWVAHLQGQVVDRQSPEVDYVSRATQSTNAFYYAVVQALSKAK